MSKKIEVIENKKIEVIEKEFNSSLLEFYEEIKNKVKDKHEDLVIVNNIFLIFQKLFENKDKKGDYVECGVFKGGTLIPAITFSEETEIDFNFFGADTFKGFPNSKHHENDLPKKFIRLFSESLISQNHFIKARERTDTFNDLSHLESSYFNHDFSKLFEFCSARKNVNLLKGNFSKVLSNFDKKIDILHIDCDLYESYKECLNLLYNKVIKGGCIIFDEYYSHKYPGARIAVDEFFKDKSGYFEKYTTPEGFERWCFIKG